MKTKEDVEEYAQREELTTRSRKRENVYRRAYLAMYLNQLGVSYFESAIILGLMGKSGVPDHASIKHYVEVVYPNYHEDELFLNITMNEFEEFPITGHTMGFPKKRLVLCKLTEKEYKKLTIARLKGNFKTNSEALLSLL